MSFYAVFAHNFDDFIGIMARYGNQSAMVMKSYLAYLIASETTYFGQGSDNVCLGKLFLFPGMEKQSCNLRCPTLRCGGRFQCFHIGNGFLSGPDQIIYGAGGAHAGGAAIAVGSRFRSDRKMIMYH